MIVNEPMYGSAISIHAHAWNSLHQMCMHEMFTSEHQRESYSHNHFSLNDDRSARSIWGRTWNVFMSTFHLKGTDNQPCFKR